MKKQVRRELAIKWNQVEDLEMTKQLPVGYSPIETALSEFLSILCYHRGVQARKIH